MKTLSIRAQILWLALFLVLVSLGMLAFLTVYQLDHQLHEGLETKAMRICGMVAENVGPGLEFNDSLYVTDMVRGVFVDGDIVALCVRNETDRIVFLRDNTEVLDTTRTSFPTSDSVSVYHDGNLCVACGTVRSRGRRVGSIWIAFSQDAMHGRIQSSVMNMLAGSGLVLMIVVIVGSVMSRRIVAPIRSFEVASERIRSGDMVSTIDVPSLHKDFHSLGNAFNAMQGALKEAFEELNRSRDNLEEEVEIRTRELLQELSERKRAEKALMFTQFAIDHAADAAFWMDSDGRVIYANEVACSSLGYTRTELESMSIHEIVPEFTREMWPESWQQAKRLGSFTLETEHRAKDGTSIPVEVTVSFMEYGGHEYNCAFARNISDRKWAEQQERELREKLERAERMESLGILAGGVAHDLNNMLGPLVGYPELILMKLPEDSPVRKQVQRLGSAARDAADVIQDLLTLARRGRYEMEPTDLNEVMRSYLDSPSFDSLRERFRSVEVTTHLSGTLPAIRGSAPHLSKVVMNLIVNAFDAMPDGGTLSVETSCQSLSRLIGGHEQITPGDYVLLRVRDTGTGIAEEDLAKIFEPYYSKKQMGTSGSGLGLSVVYGVVKDHGGYYDILSTLEHGTEFILYFPVSKVAQLAVKPKSKIAGGKESILVIDDAPEQRKLAIDLLSSLGYEVQTAENGTEGVHFLEGHKADIVLLDMIMEPGFDGLDTYSEILRLHPGQRAILVSGYAATDRVERAQQLGAGAYVRKPYTRDTIARAVREELDKVRAPVSA